MINWADTDFLLYKIRHLIRSKIGQNYRENYNFSELSLESHHFEDIVKTKNCVMLLDMINPN